MLAEYPTDSWAGESQSKFWWIAGLEGWSQRAERCAEGAHFRRITIGVFLIAMTEQDRERKKEEIVGWR